MAAAWSCRSEEHTSELQSLRHLVCRLLLEKKKRFCRIVIFNFRYDFIYHLRHVWYQLIRCQFFFLIIRRQPRSTLFPYTPLFRSSDSTSATTCKSRPSLLAPAVIVAVSR